MEKAPAKAPIGRPPARPLPARRPWRLAPRSRPPRRAPHGSAPRSSGPQVGPSGPRHAAPAARLALIAPTALRDPAQPFRPRLARLVSTGPLLGTVESHPFHRRGRRRTIARAWHARTGGPHPAPGQSAAPEPWPRTRRIVSPT